MNIVRMPCDTQAATRGPARGAVTVELPWYAALPIHGLHVYWLYAAEGTLLYVGQTKSPRSRLRRHARRFGGEFASWRIVPVETREEAEWVERDSIETDEPLYNIAVGTGRFGE